MEECVANLTTRNLPIREITKVAHVFPMIKYLYSPLYIGNERHMSCCRLYQNQMISLIAKPYTKSILCNIIDLTIPKMF